MKIVKNKTVCKRCNCTMDISNSTLGPKYCKECRKIICNLMVGVIK